MFTNTVSNKWTETTKKIELKDNLTVSQAIAKAGGILAASKKDKVVIRRIENDQSIDAD